MASVLAGTILALLSVASASAANKRNILFIMGDDIGWVP